MNRIIKAAQYAADVHAGQVRKYTGMPYICHPARVAGRVAIHPEATEEMVMAAFLHDTVEDTETTFEDIRFLFGNLITNLVIDLTDPFCTGLADTCKGKPRAERKAIARAHLMGSCREAQIIKMIDRIDNLRDMPLTPPNSYTKMYLDESLLLAKAIGSADLTLMAELVSLCEADYEPDTVPVLVTNESVLSQGKIEGGLDELKRLNEK
jgi:(p)ppGpp synthase/HD superfamily hydrolase